MHIMSQPLRPSLESKIFRVVTAYQKITMAQNPKTMNIKKKIYLKDLQCYSLAFHFFENCMRVPAPNSKSNVQKLVGFYLITIMVNRSWHTDMQPAEHSSAKEPI